MLSRRVLLAQTCPGHAGWRRARGDASGLLLPVGRPHRDTKPVPSQLKARKERTALGGQPLGSPSASQAITPRPVTRRWLLGKGRPDCERSAGQQRLRFGAESWPGRLPRRRLGRSSLVPPQGQGDDEASVEPGLETEPHNS